MKLQESLKAIENYKKESPHYVDLLDILSEILVLREQFSRNMKEDVFTVDDKYVDVKLAGGMPLVDTHQKKNLVIPEKYFHTLLKSMESKFPEEVAAFNEQCGKDVAYRDLLIAYHIVEATDEQGAELEATDEACELEAELSDESFDIIGMLLRESLRPGFERVIKKYAKQLLAHQWNEGFCPICGSEPKIGEIKGEEGHRHLYCHQCGYEWIFPRIMCPFCGNSDHQSLLYFTVEGNENYRVDTCNECRQYIKIVDLRDKKQETNLEIEDIATLHLDIIANDEGYE